MNAAARCPISIVAAIAALVTSRAIAAPRATDPTTRPIRYRPVDRGFEIINGGESFNRPLYGGNNAFRVDAGDRPEFSLYLPGRGGVLRVGVATPGRALWLRDAQSIAARYADGSMRYVVRDPTLPDATIRLTAVALRDAEGLAVQVEADGIAVPSDVLFAFGGLNGEKGKRDGDIGTEALPVGEFFALRPEHCRDNVIAPADAGFTLRAKSEQLAGVAAGGAIATAIVDARHWDDAAELRHSAGGATDAPAALVTVRLAPGKPATFVVVRSGPATTRPAATGPSDLDASFDRAVAQNRAVARQVVVDTPDPYVDAAVDAMCVAADALWDDAADSFMHGGVAWRRRYLGWRGPYAGDATGRHGRTRAHLDGYFAKQNVEPIDDAASGADVAENLARSERLLHSNGDLTGTHYDMNLVAVDAFFRHLLWTGDLDYAARCWPTIERHLAWERRLFRRDFAGGPLYEAYACIWASDDLQYGGGGVAHASAYNAFHNAMAARVATLLGKDGAPYQREADGIVAAMKANLWLADRGAYAECKDLLGRQLVHPSAGLWTTYHTIDSRVPDAMSAWQMCHAIDAPRIPLRGIPDGDFATRATTDWMPYDWSTNNVVMAEVTHTALAEWQAGRPEQAMATWKSAVLDAMYLGLCPGNLGMTSALDAYRGESQRDFGDPVGATWRATIEGLFGIQPDALAGELTIRPGFPRAWDHASIEHPDVSYAFRRDGTHESFEVASHFAKPMKLRLIVPAERTQATVTINGQPAKPTNVDDAVGRPAFEIDADAAATWDVAIDWGGHLPATTIDGPAAVASGQQLAAHVGTEIIGMSDPQGALAHDGTFRDRTITGTVAGTTGDRTLFVRLQQDFVRWWQPIEFEIRPAVEIENARVEGPAIAFSIRSTGATLDPSAAAVVDPSGAAHPLHASAAATSSPAFRVDGVPIAPGTNRLTLRVAGNADVSFDVVDWNVPLSDARLEAVDLAPQFNDRVTQIFKNQYRSPRSPYASLSIPTQGFGGWATNKTTPAIDDAGLRALGGELKLPCGVTFRTPSDADAKNVLFVSQWDNYPREATVPLSGRAAKAYLLMAGSTNAMQSRLDNGEVVIAYADGGTERLPLRNPDTWWPIDQDYRVDGRAFAIAAAIPPRVDLKTGVVRLPTAAQLARSGRNIPGGAATVLDVPLDPHRELRSLTVRALANDVVIGLMGVTLHR